MPTQGLMTRTWKLTELSKLPDPIAYEIVTSKVSIRAASIVVIKTLKLVEAVALLFRVGSRLSYE
jgi:hypothetical protein